MSRRLSLCYAAPGHALLTTSGSARNVLAAAAALSEWADVTVAFRDIIELPADAPFAIEAIAPVHRAGNARDDVAARGLNPFDHVSYLRKLARYADERRGSYDLVLEKGWRLSGYLAGEFLERGVAAVLIENAVHRWHDPIRTPRALAQCAFHLAAHLVSSTRSRRLPLIIAETAELRRALETHRRIPPERIEVVGLGVDHSLFRPISQESARESLGVSKAATVMLYVGGLDRYHDLSPLLHALAAQHHEDLELHVIGDGEYRGRYESIARATRVPVRFHGHLPHATIPMQMAASDVCVAPYRTEAFHGSEVGFSTLKIPEYMACAKPVISVPSGHILSLIEPGKTGFLFPNEPDEWARFLNQRPSRPVLAEMGRAAAASTRHLSWRATAGRYLECCRPLIPIPAR